MRVSEYYNLNRTQAGLDFVDVDIETDATIFVDPRAIRLQTGHWALECQALLQSFFSEILDSASTGNGKRVEELLGRLNEPNETHLGYSRGRSRGRGLGRVKATEVADAFSLSLAATTGLLEDLEDAALFIPGIERDIVSDIAINVLRGALIGYTQSVADYHGIVVEEQYTGPVWNPNSVEWQEGFESLPRAQGDKLILVPKSIVRHHLIFDKDKYYRGYIAPYLEAKEADAKSELVTTLKNGSTYVNRVKLKEKYPSDKLAIVKYTLEFPEALKVYRREAGRGKSTLLDHQDLASTVGSPNVNYNELLEELLAISPGKYGAHAYHRAVEQLLTALFYPSLANFQLEAEIHEGRKRIDILYDNLAASGFFSWINANWNCPVIPVECKNYSEDPKNPELDQLSGRLSRDRGWVGILVCRKIEDKNMLVKRCRDTAKDGRGYLIALDDADLRELVTEAGAVRTESLERRSRYTLLRRIWDDLIG